MINKNAVRLEIQVKFVQALAPISSHLGTFATWLKSAAQSKGGKKACLPFSYHCTLKG